MLATSFGASARAQTQPAPKGAAVAAPVTADPAALASAHRLMEVMHTDRTMALMFQNLTPLLINSTVTALEANQETAEIMKRMEASRPSGRERVMVIFREEFDVAVKMMSAQTIDQSAQEYAAAFSKAELDEIIAFYSSGTGKKVVELMPGLQQKMSQFGRQAGVTVGKVAGEKAIRRAMQELLPKKETRS
jgi:hypothetical protein